MRLERSVFAADKRRGGGPYRQGVPESTKPETKCSRSTPFYRMAAKQSSPLDKIHGRRGFTRRAKDSDRSPEGDNSPARETLAGMFAVKTVGNSKGVI